MYAIRSYYAGSGLLALLVARLMNYNRYAFIPSMMFSNVANMGLPLTLFAFSYNFV